MKKKDVRKLCVEFTRLAPDFVYGAGANAIFGEPVGKVFRGIVFDSSGFNPNMFYPHCFVMPLYLPADGFRMNIGQRLQGNWCFKDGSEAEIATELVRAMEQNRIFKRFAELSSPRALAENLPRYYSNTNDHFIQRSIAYSHFLCRDIEQGLRWVDECQNNVRKMQEMQPGIAWHKDLVDELTGLREMAKTDFDLVIKQLDDWTEATRASLKLPV